MRPSDWISRRIGRRSVLMMSIGSIHRRSALAITVKAK